jgi:predicted transcriptional regulator
MTVSAMRKSKLESCEDILDALVTEPLTIDRLAFETDMDCNLATRRLDFLIQNGLVEERALNANMVYAITERGTAVLRVLNFEKYLQKITTTIKAMDEAYQILPIMSKNKDQRRE